MTRPNTALSTSVPFPTMGWNARDPVYDMDPRFALALKNIFPETTSGRLRNGYRVHTPSGLGSGAVESLMEYAAADGTRKLLAAANGNIYNCSTYNAAATDLAGAFGAFTNNRWNHVMFRTTAAGSVMIMMNGDDQPKQYDGTTLTDASYTDAGLADDNALIWPHVYKSRVYAVEKNTTVCWYTAANAFTGAVTAFDVGSLLKLGGYLNVVSSCSLYTGSGLQDIFAFIADTGEILIYSGTDPGSWSIVGRFFIAPPIGRRCVIQYKNDLLIVTTEGIVSLSEIVLGKSSEEAAITNVIKNSFSDAARLYKDNFGWQPVHYARGHYMAFNIPLAVNSQVEQYVMNTLTGAWCRFTGQNANCWSVYSNKLYFGGTDGKIYEADYGDSDNSNYISTEVKFAFNYLDDKDHIKRFSLARPLLIANNSLSFFFGIANDFEDTVITDTVSTTGVAGSVWDSDPWDSSPWATEGVNIKNWYGVSGLGRAVSIRLRGQFKTVSWTMASCDLIYEPGGYI